MGISFAVFFSSQSESRNERQTQEGQGGFVGARGVERECVVVGCEVVVRGGGGMGMDW